MTDEMVDSVMICLKHKVLGWIPWWSMRHHYHIHLLRPHERFHYPDDLTPWEEWLACHPWWKADWYPLVRVPASDYTDETMDVVRADQDGS